MEQVYPETVSWWSAQRETPAMQKEGETVWNELYKDTTHWLDTNNSEGSLVVDKMKPA